MGPTAFRENYDLSRIVILQLLNQLLMLHLHEGHIPHQLALRLLNQILSRILHSRKLQAKKQAPV
jgi:hypothetical protein